MPALTLCVRPDAVIHLPRPLRLWAVEARHACDAHARARTRHHDDHHLQQQSSSSAIGFCIIWHQCARAAGAHNQRATCTCRSRSIIQHQSSAHCCGTLHVLTFSQKTGGVKSSSSGLRCERTASQWAVRICTLYRWCVPRLQHRSEAGLSPGMPACVDGDGAHLEEDTRPVHHAATPCAAQLIVCMTDLARTQHLWIGFGVYGVGSQAGRCTSAACDMPYHIANMPAETIATKNITVEAWAWRMAMPLA